jgi:hypothetical protein
MRMGAGDGCCAMSGEASSDKAASINAAAVKSFFFNFPPRMKSTID